MNEDVGCLRRLTYTCIFAKSSDEAIENIYSLVATKQCGFVEGSNKWIEVLESTLSAPLDIDELNYHSTSFDETWWYEVLSGLVQKLKQSLEKNDEPTRLQSDRDTLSLKGFDIASILKQRQDVCYRHRLPLEVYRDAVERFPAPTRQQMRDFADYVCEAHSWYKHLPYAPPGAAFFFYIDPWAGMDRVLLNTGEAVHVHRTNESGGFRGAAWLTTQDYHRRFGRMQFSSDCHDEIFCGVSMRLTDGRMIRGALDVNRTRHAFYTAPTEECRISSELLSGCCAFLTSVIHPMSSNKEFVEIWLKLFDQGIFADMEEPLHAKNELAQLSKSKDSVLVERALDEILALERQKQKDSMVVAMERAVQLLYDD